MSQVQKREFEGGVKVSLENIDPDIQVHVWLPEEGSWRFAGKFDPYTGILFLKRFMKHRHNILNAFGISAYVIEALEPMGLKLFVLDVEDTRETLTLTLDKLKTEAVWKYWKEGGFDRQAFVAIPLWEKK
jgi:hypothetical protein